MAWSDACGLARPGTQIAWIALVQKLPGSPWYTNCLDRPGTKIAWIALVHKLPGSPRYKNCLDCPGSKIAWIALAQKLPASPWYKNCLDLLGTKIAWSDAGSMCCICIRWQQNNGPLRHPRARIRSRKGPLPQQPEHQKPKFKMERVPFQTKVLS